MLEVVLCEFAREEADGRAGVMVSRVVGEMAWSHLGLRNCMGILLVGRWMCGAWKAGVE